MSSKSEEAREPTQPQPKRPPSTTTHTHHRPGPQGLPKGPPRSTAGSAETAPGTHPPTRQTKPNGDHGRSLLPRVSGRGGHQWAGQAGPTWAQNADQETARHGQDTQQQRRPPRTHQHFLTIGLLLCPYLLLPSNPYPVATTFCCDF